MSGVRRIARRQRERAGAIAAWNEALQHDPTHLQLHELLVEALDQSGQDAAADRQRRKFLLLTEKVQLPAGRSRA